MPKYTVLVACDMPCYDVVNIEANSPGHMVQKLKDDIAKPGPRYFKGCMPDYSIEPTQYRIVHAGLHNSFDTLLENIDLDD